MKAKNENKETPTGAPEVTPEAEPDFLKQYRQCYPKAKKFYITADGLVFPDKPEAARKHQATLSGGELKTY